VPQPSVTALFPRFRYFAPQWSAGIPLQSLQTDIGTAARVRGLSQWTEKDADRLSSDHDTQLAAQTTPSSTAPSPPQATRRAGNRYSRPADSGRIEPRTIINQ